ncbi:MAG: polyprenyl synthetase family protein [Planctomycetes bacterium]|nr:polyprenyl synthetase family protein [Planctomycetota bacterium]
MLTQFLLEEKKRVENELRSAIRYDDNPARLPEAMAYALVSQGKKIRPLLVQASCDALGGNVDDSLPVAAAIEMIHTYSLVHDDLPCMDDDDLRRGRQTVHKAFDEATAILAGNGLLTLAFEVVIRSKLSAEKRLRILEEFTYASGWKGILAGQALDLEAEGKIRGAHSPEIRKDSISEAIRRKTGHFGGVVPDLETPGRDSMEGSRGILDLIHRCKTAVLLQAACKCGAIVAGASENQVAELDKFGRLLGLAFQYRDDILDVSSTREALGKTPGKDERQGKLTAPFVYGLDGARLRLSNFLAEARTTLEKFEKSEHLLGILDLLVIE